MFESVRKGLKAPLTRVISALLSGGETLITSEGLVGCRGRSCEHRSPHCRIAQRKQACAHGQPTRSSFVPSSNDSTDRTGYRSRRESKRHGPAIRALRVFAARAGRDLRLRESGSADLVLDVRDVGRLDGPDLHKRERATLDPLE